MSMISLWLMNKPNGFSFNSNSILKKKESNLKLERHRWSMNFDIDDAYFSLIDGGCIAEYE